jgi:hypothetical protein
MNTSPGGGRHGQAQVAAGLEQPIPRSRRGTTWTRRWPRSPGPPRLTPVWRQRPAQRQRLNLDIRRLILLAIKAKPMVLLICSEGRGRGQCPAGAAPMIASACAANGQCCHGLPRSRKPGACASGRGRNSAKGWRPPRVMVWQKPCLIAG